jgi:hypothetical protein
MSKVNTANGDAKNFQLRIKKIDVNPVPIIINGIPSLATGSLLFILFWSN